MVSQAESNRALGGFSIFYKTRRRVYGALLLFVIVVGLPIASIPKLRYRFLTRAQVLGNAIVGKRAPVLVQVGENRKPLPAEFERLAPPVPQAFQLPRPAKVLSTTQVGPAPRRDEIHLSPKTGNSKMTSPPSNREEETTEQSEPEAAAASNQPKYQQGKIEQEAYDLLLQSNPAIAAIVQGNNPSFKFKSWDAAGRGEDTFWVRLKLQSGGGPEAEYIWQVKLQSKQVSPLNYNARSIS